MRLLSRRFTVRSFRPSIEPLECRYAPATFAYNAVTQSLSIKAVAGEQIKIIQDANKPTGNLEVSSNQTPVIFNDPAGNTVFVKNLSLKITAGPGGPGQVTLSAGVNIAGNFAITTADPGGTSLNALSGVSIGGNLTFTSTATATAAADFFNLPNLQTGGSVTLTMGSGNNTVTSLGNAIIGANLGITGAGGNDTVMNFSGNVGGSATFNFGAGTNSLTVIAPGPRIGKSFSYTGTTGNDTVTLTNGFLIGGKATFNVGAGNNALNTTGNGILAVGLNMTYTGTTGDDTITFDGPLNCLGSVTVNVGGGTNTFTNSLFVDIGLNFIYNGTSGDDNINLANNSSSSVTVRGNLICTLGNGTNAVTVNGSFAIVEGKLSILGGTGVDNVTIQNLFVSKTLSIDLGNSMAGQMLLLLSCQVGQGLFLMGGNNDDTFNLSTLNVLGTTAITTLAGNDTLEIDNAIDEGDSAFAGPTTLDTGAGNDTVKLETDTSGGKMSFGTKLTILGGTDNDDLFLGFDNTSTLIFGGPTTFNGGTGTNTRTDAAGVVILDNGNTIVGTNGW